MYGFKEMIDTLGFEDGKENSYPSESHKIVAHRLFCCNPRINSREILMANMNLLNSLTKEEVEKMTYVDFIVMGMFLI